MKPERIFLSAPDCDELEERFVLDALRSGWVAPSGPELDRFESEVAAYVGTKYAVAVSSGTAALHLGLVALGVNSNDVVITSTLTFAATANAIMYVGARPYFVDVDESTGNIDVDLLKQAVQGLISGGKNVAAIIPVDLFGKAANLSEIQKLGQHFSIPVLVDAAESFGAMHHGKQTGAWCDAAIYSFNGNKILTTSGGGIFVTNNEHLAERVRFLSTQAREAVSHYEHKEVGYNYRLSNILAAIGRAQLVKFDEMLKRRRELRNFYRELFAKVEGVSILGGDADHEDNCWLTAILVDSSRSGWNNQELADALALENIESRPIWKPMHMQPVFHNLPSKLSGVAEKLFDRGITLPSGSVLTTEDRHRLEMVLRTFLATKNSHV